jgi:hypothetical protein
LHCSGKVNGLVERPGAVGCGLAGGQERELAWSSWIVLLDQVGDALLVG